MPVVYNFLDYREFLKKYYEEKKADNPVFSYQNFANKAGFKTKSFIKMVIDGKKNLSEDSLNKLSRAMKLDAKAHSYFEDLVSFNQSKSLKIQNQILEKLLTQKMQKSGKLIQQSQYEFYSSWFHTTIREMLPYMDFAGAMKSNYEKLGSLLNPPISGVEAKRSVELMLELGLLKKNKTGNFEQSDPIVTTGDDIQSLAVRNFYLQVMILGGKSIENIPAEMRDMSCLIVRLSRKGFQIYKDEINRLRKRLLDLSEKDSDFSHVYLLNTLLIPTTDSLPR